MKNKILLSLFSYIEKVFCIVLVCLSASCKPCVVADDAAISAAEALIWSRPDSSLCILESLDLENMPKNTYYKWLLIREHACSRLHLDTSPDSVMPEVIRYFQEVGDQENLAKSYYIQGVEYYTQTDYYDAMRAIKEAESLLDYLPDTLPFASLTYHLLGAISETDGLMQIAHNYYCQGLEYALRRDDEFRIACFYRDVARTEPANDSLAMAYYQMALQHAENIENKLLYYDIYIQMELQRPQVDSALLYDLCIYMNDTLGQPRYMGFVIEYLLSQRQIAQAEQRLAEFACDTNLYTTIAERYLYCESLLNAHKGYTREAFAQIDMLYLDLREQVEMGEKSRTYTISRMYDVEQEKNKNLQLTIRQQRLWIGIGIATALFLILVIGIWGFYQREHTRRIISEQDAEIARLKTLEAEEELRRSQAEIAEKRCSLRKVMQQRIQLTQQIRLSVEGTKDIPLRLKKTIRDLSFANPHNWEKFIDEFNQLYDNVLSTLKNEYPGITRQDEEYLALSILGLNSNEIAVLLDINQQSVWNRRQRIRNHIGDATVDIDDWISKQRKRCKY